MAMMIALLLLMTSAVEYPSTDQGLGQNVSGKNVVEQSGSAAKAPEDAIAHVLDLGMRLGDPFPTNDSMPPIPSEANKSKARSIIRLATIARQRGLDRSKDVVLTLDTVKEMLLAEKLMQAMSNSVVIDQQEVRKQFDLFPDRYDEFELSHIFLALESQSDQDQTGEKEALARATKVQARLKAGEDFARVANEMSDDKESAINGGVLPTILGAYIQPAFLGQVKTMKPGSVSGIVKGTQGYHIIKLVDRTHVYGGPARDMIEREIRTREIRRLLPELQRLESSVK